MYAVAFDLVVADTKANHPKGDPSAAYREIYVVLVGRHGFEWKQGSLYTPRRRGTWPGSSRPSWT